MKRLLTLLLVVLSGSTAFAASKTEQLPDWQNPNVVERNRAPMTATFETDGLRLSLNGTWKFQWYESIPVRSLDFFNVIRPSPQSYGRHARRWRRRGTGSG